MFYQFINNKFNKILFIHLIYFIYLFKSINCIKKYFVIFRIEIYSITTIVFIVIIKKILTFFHIYYFVWIILFNLIIV